MRMKITLLIVTGFAPFLFTGCAADASRDCWFTYSNPISPSELLWTPTDPLVDLWTLPYSPCDLAGKREGRERD